VNDVTAANERRQQPRLHIGTTLLLLDYRVFSGDYAGVEGVGRVKNQPAISLAVALAL
jgi:hypothetical protein